MPGACRHVAVLALFAVTLAMYEAKRSGRDRALRHSPPLGGADALASAR